MHFLKVYEANELDVRWFKSKDVRDGHKWQPPVKVYRRHKGLDYKAKSIIWHTMDDNSLSWDFI